MVKVIIVDDSKDIGAIVGLLLAKMGFDTRAASTGQKALLLVREFCPHVAILDIVMPGMCGYALAREIRARYPSIGLIALTGLVTLDCRLKATKAGFDNFLLKPIEMGKLCDAINRLAKRPPALASAKPMFPFPRPATDKNPPN